MIIDHAKIFIRSGKGGDGCVSLRREKYLPKGGPDGGDGGKGGDVVLVGDKAVTTLVSIASRPHIRARQGQPGQGASKHGADGAGVTVRIPLGTLVYDENDGELVVDVTEDGQEFIAAAGGRGGFGNEHFKSATNQTPREATPGEPRIDRTLRLELKLIADVGLIGKPNAGKSTLLRSVTRADPKVADYPFTTLSPHLGIAELPGGRTGAERRLVIADLPGLIEGAAEGAGLGHDFLRHVERTKLLVHVLDAQPPDGSDPADHYHAIRDELARYSAALAEKHEVVVLNKMDLVPADERETLVGTVAGRLGLTDDDPFHVTSGATGEGTREMLESCWRALGRGTPSGWSVR